MSIIVTRRALTGCALLLSLAPHAGLAATPEVDLRFRKALGRDPQPPQPIGDYVPARRTGHLLYTSTTSARTKGVPDFQGAVGGELTLEQGKQAARAAALAVLEGVYQTLGNTLAPVTQLVNMIGYVASADGFYDQAGVMDGATALMVEVLGADMGRSSRSAIGVKAMSRRSAIGIAAVFEVA